jgi:hypothetical protein
MGESSEYQRGLAAGRMENYEERLQKIETDLATMVAWVNQQKGGKMTLSAMLTTAGAFGAGIAEVIHWITHPK